ncbi:response regulator transcription factor [Microvirga sp. 0TCS3.31]
MTAAPIRVVVADDQPLIRAGIRTLCEKDQDIVVVGEAADGAQAVDVVISVQPDVVLMDIRMPLLDGIRATGRILAERPLTRVLVITTYETPELVFSALRGGASGFLAKDVAPERLREAIRTVHLGESLLSPKATRALIAEFVDAPARLQVDDHTLAPLTEREREVLAWVGRGHDNAGIGRGLHLSPATVKTHVNRAMAKLGAHDRAQLVVLAYETGLVRPGEDAGAVDRARR